MPDNFIHVIAACLAHDQGTEAVTLENLVQRVVNSPDRPTGQELAKLQQEIKGQLPSGHDRIALVYGGATKIKGYVFEAPRLPEIRGASALLDWVNESALKDLWLEHAELGLDKNCIVYASGGNILAFAPASQGEKLATAIEHCYTDATVTGN